MVSGIYDDLPYTGVILSEEKEVEKEGEATEEVKAGWLTAYTAETLLNGHIAQQFVTGKGSMPTVALSRCFDVPFLCVYLSQSTLSHYTIPYHTVLKTTMHYSTLQNYNNLT